MKYLYFMEATDGEHNTAQDSVCYPVSSFKGFGASGTITTLLLHFENLLDSNEDGNDVITLTIPANKQKEVGNAIVREINKGGGDDFIVVADDSNSEYVDSRITACSIAVTAID